MFMKLKYIITEDKNIIVFPKHLNHSDFKIFKPINAGFISFNLNKEHELTCFCYGESISLKLKSNSEIDTLIAKRQLNMDDY